MTDKSPASVPQVAPQDVHDTAPALGWYSDHALFHRIWNRPGLSRRDRSVVTVSALIACGHFAQLTGHLNRALNHGLTPDEITELVTHLAFQAGWPNAMSALKVVREVFASRDIPLSGQGQPIGSPLDLDSILGDGAAAPDFGQSSSPFSAILGASLGTLVEQDVWKRPGLSPRDRSTATLSLLIASGNTSQLLAEGHRALANGLSLAELGEIVLHLGFYVGLPRVGVMAEVLDSLTT